MMQTNLLGRKASLAGDTEFAYEIVGVYLSGMNVLYVLLLDSAHGMMTSRVASAIVVEVEKRGEVG